MYKGSKFFPIKVDPFLEGVVTHRSTLKVTKVVPFSKNGWKALGKKEYLVIFTDSFVNSA